IVHSGAFGSFQHFSLENFATDETLLRGHWFWDQAQSGGIHVEHGVHCFDICNQLAAVKPDFTSGCAQPRADGRVDRVSATVRYGDSALATFFHSFTQIRSIEQTTIQINCARGHLTVSGWIPTELTLSGLTDEAGLNTLHRLLGTQLEIMEHFQGPQRRFLHGGTEDHLVAHIRAHVTAPDRQGDYKRAIQSGLRNLVRAIWKEEALIVTPEDGLLSLSVALAARDSTCGQP
ncbi:MAG TPA: Gfo/Idh/MocA family oxidoreductase, partial [Phototrophicaceae bacterium]|nr:Gfo/Idh/MocA family oxidoreductase [Phototrophicaceae bacterium]